MIAPVVLAFFLGAVSMLLLLTLREVKPMSAVMDSFARYVAYRDQKEADAVSAAVEAEKANHQAEIDAAVEAAEAADAAAIDGAIPAVEPAPEPAPEG